MTMAALKADTTALSAHADLLDRMAQFYFDLALSLESHGAPVVREFHRTTHNDDDGAQYQRWLNFDELQKQSDNLHQKAQFLREYVIALQALEGQFTVDDTNDNSGIRGRQHVE